MTRNPVKSSHIKAVGYDPETRTMEIEFASGGSYTYSDVEADMHDKFIGAESIGKHFREHLRSKLTGSRLDVKPGK